MKTQGMMALMPPAGAATWTASELPGTRVLSSLRASNLAFLDLLADAAPLAAAGSAGVVLPRLEPPAAAPAARQAVVEALPFALFDLRYRDDPFWRAAAAGAAAVHDAAACPRVDPSLRSFARIAVVFSWHAVEVCTPSASLVLGASAGVLRLLGDLPLALLEPLSGRVAPAVAARFAQRALFWERLGQCLRDPDSRQLERLRLLGLQLQGTESARRLQLQRRGARREP